VRAESVLVSQCDPSNQNHVSGAESTHAQRARSIGVASSVQLLSYLNSPSATANSQLRWRRRRMAVGKV